MRRLRRSATPFAVAVVALTLYAAPVVAQSNLEDALRQLNSANGRGYLQPLADLFSADMHSGWYHTAKVGKSPFSFGFELVAAGSAIEDKHRTYIATTPEGFSPSSFTTPTIFGGEAVPITSTGGTEFRGSDGLIAGDYFPAPLPQFRIGIKGTEAIVRYASTSFISSIEEGDVPDVTLLAVGLRHSISDHFDGWPVDVAVGVFYSSLDIGGDAGDEGVSADYTGLSVGVQASKTFSLLTIFAGAASDGGKMTLGYITTDPEEAGAISIDLDVKRKMKFTGGASIKLGPVRLFGDASFGPATTYSGGLRIGS